MDSETHQLVTPDPQSEKSSNLQTSVNLFKCSVGIGVLALPYYFNAAGYLLSSILMIIITSLSFYTTLKIIELAELKGLKETNYETLYKEDVGKWAFFYFEICMGVSYGGVCACYVIFGITFFKNVFGTTDIMHTLIYALFFLLIIIPLSFIRKFEFFVKYSFLANFLMMVVFLAVYYHCIMNFNSENVDNLGNFSEFFGILGVFLFAFESPGQILQIRNSMKNRDDFKWNFLVVNSLVLLLYVSFSTVCSLGFTSSQLTQNILTGFGSINSFYLGLEGFYAIALIISYPIQLNPLLLVLENIPKVKYFLEKNEKNCLKKNSVRILVSLVIFPCSLFIDNLADFVSFLGIFCGLIMQFVFPLWAYNSYMRERLDTKLKYFHYFIISISLIATVSASYSSIATLIEDYE